MRLMSFSLVCILDREYTFPGVCHPPLSSTKAYDHGSTSSSSRTSGISRVMDDFNENICPFETLRGSSRSFEKKKKHFICLRIDFAEVWWAYVNFNNTNILFQYFFQFVPYAFEIIYNMQLFLFIFHKILAEIKRA